MAIEFAILALPFFTIIFAILETAMVFFAQQILESAVQDTSRFIQTGQAQATGTDWNIDNFRTAMCTKLYGLFDCHDAGKMRIIVRPVGTFTDANVDLPINADCTPGGDPTKCDWAVQNAYNDGTRNQVMVVQVYYKWPTVVNLPWFNLETQAGGTRLLSAVRVFRNEPF